MSNLKNNNMDLIEILQTNGTGLLSGTCRFINPHFLSFHDFFKKTEKNNRTEFVIAFSLNEKNLGTFEIKCSDYIFANDRKDYKKTYTDMSTIGFHATMASNIWLEILWDPFEKEFCTFKAIKEIYD